MKKWLKKAYHFAKEKRAKRLNERAQVNEEAIFLLGNQKSGTSAIAALLAELTGLSVTIDIRGIKEPVQSQLHKREMSFKTFVENNRYDFSKQIVKEPSLTFLYDDLKAAFPNGTFVFIVRDPRDNIRSILNRINLPGDLPDIDEADERWLQAPIDWQRVIDGRWLGLGGRNYVEQMAERWNLAVDIYERNKEEMVLIRYEDFLQDKAGEIERLAKKLGHEKVNDIDDKVDIQYQPAGNRKVKKQDFFGAENLTRIERICADRMERFGYERTQV